jgi:hypothetical protein
MQACAVAVVTMGLLAGCAELDAVPSGSGGKDAAPGQTAPSTGGQGAPSLGQEGPLERTPTPCLDGVAPRPNAVKSVVLPGSAGAPGFDLEGEPSTGITVFDRSGSMSVAWSTGAVTEGEATDAVLTDKWTAASEALVASILPVQHRVTIGAILFPQPDGCEVAALDDERQFRFQPGPDFIASWEERHSSYRPTGQTPLQSAFVRVEQALEQACLDGALEERHYVVLLTDGEPNCGTDIAQVEAMAAHWLAHGIPTYVFGLPGYESAQQVLDRIAIAGGTSAIAVGGTSAIVTPDTPTDLGNGMGAIR